MNFADGLELEKEIKRSRSLLEYEDDWDGEGSIGYEEETWTRAVEFLRREQMGRFVVPSILPGPEGSFDVVWRQAAARLYMNFPRDDTKAVFFGTDVGETIRGSSDTSRQIHSGLIAGLKEKFGR